MKKLASFDRSILSMPPLLPLLILRKVMEFRLPFPKVNCNYFAWSNRVQMIHCYSWLFKWKIRMKESCDYFIICHLQSWPLICLSAHDTLHFNVANTCYLYFQDILICINKMSNKRFNVLFWSNLFLTLFNHWVIEST